ncbi:hypothetical protein U8P76_18560 [Rhizobium johnstonii]|nr:hypothetical protein U8P76_18560 [Rhizobium johnstonii]
MNVINRLIPTPWLSIAIVAAACSTCRRHGSKPDDAGNAGPSNESRPSLQG